MKKISFYFSLILVIMIACLGSGCSLTDFFSTKHFVVYDYNGGTGEISSEQIKDGQPLNLPQATREGYNFIGWYYNGVLWNKNAIIDYDIELEAMWSPKNYIITFVVDGVSYNEFLPYDSMPIFHGELIKEPSSSSSYIFDRWEPSLEIIKGNATYTAVFSESNNVYTLALQNENSDAGIVSGAGNYEYGTNVNVSAIANNGYEFIGWYKNGELFSNQLSISVEMIENITLTAKFKKLSKTINYFNTKSAQNVNPTSYDINMGDITLANLELEGYTFDGWYNEQTGGEKIEVIDVGEFVDVNLYAQWTLINYSMQYNLDGGAVSSANPTTYNIESSSITLNNPTKTGYTFAGWTGTGLSGKTNTVTIPCGSTGNRTYTANWEEQVVQEQTASINYNIDGVDFSELKVTQNVGTAVSAPTITPESYGMAGYSFDGWYTNSALTTKYTFATMPDSDITLYGTWNYILDEGFYPYLEKFKTANTSTYLNINSYKELVAYYEYVHFYDITTQNKIKLTYATLTSDELFAEFNEANNDCAYPINTITRYSSYGTSCGTIYIKASKRDVESTLVADSTKAYTCEQLDSAYILENESKRESGFDKFKVNNVLKTLTVETSNQLVYALVKGLKPVVVSGSDAEHIYSKAKQVLREICNDTMTDLDKVRAIYEWLIINVQYDNYAANNLTDDWIKYNSWYAEGVFDNGVAVCDGISKAFIILAKMENIPCIRVVSENHAWNKVYINNIWYGIDSTHGNVIIKDNDYEILSYTSFLFTDSYKEGKGYTATNYLDIKATTSFNYYDYYEYTYNDTSFDLCIDSNEEFANVLLYISNFTTSDDYYTIEISINFATNIDDLIRAGESASGVDVQMKVSLSDTMGKNVYNLWIK